MYGGLYEEREGYRVYKEIGEMKVCGRYKEKDDIGKQSTERCMILDQNYQKY
jgi:hypothetical protein